LEVTGDFAFHIDDAVTEDKSPRFLFKSSQAGTGATRVQGTNVRIAEVGCSIAEVAEDWRMLGVWIDRISKMPDQLRHIDMDRPMNRRVQRERTAVTALPGSVALGTSPSTSYLEPWQARSVREYMSLHLQSEIKTGELARVTQSSRRTFKRAFTATFGCTPRHYLIHMRIARAQSLMSMCGDSLGQIALACGFKDQYHFSNCFSRIVGERPGTWRAHRTLEATEHRLLT
jgi:AraC-like DNA-binding protein